LILESSGKRSSKISRTNYEDVLAREASDFALPAAHTLREYPGINELVGTPCVRQAREPSNLLVRSKFAGGVNLISQLSEHERARGVIGARG